MGAADRLRHRRCENPSAVLLKMEARSQAYASAVLQSALLLFVAKLGLLVGASLLKILASGYALLFQELGHFFGTASIAAEAPGEIDEGRLPASNDTFEGRNVTGDNAGDESLVGRFGWRRVEVVVLVHMQSSCAVRPG